MVRVKKKTTQPPSWLLDDVMQANVGLAEEGRVAREMEEKKRWRRGRPDNPRHGGSARPRRSVPLEVVAFNRLCK